MSKPQIAVRIPPSLLEKLDSYVERLGVSRTDVVVSAIATYLGSSSKIPLSQRVTELEAKVEQLQVPLEK